MIAARHAFITLTAIVVSMFAFGTASAANVTVFSNDLEGWTAAAGTPVLIEDFEDLELFGFAITFGTTPNVDGCPVGVPGGCINGGLYRDRADDFQATKPVFTFRLPVTAFGANWNLFVPTGPGTNIRLFLTFVDNTTKSVETEIPRTFQGQFFGIASDMPIVSIRFDEGSGAGAVETFDMDNARFVVDAQVVATVVGNGQICADPATPCGDGGLATAAQLSDPQGVAVDPLTGDLYIADTNNHRIRKVSAVSKTITTVVGTGVSGFNGDGPALQTRLSAPTGVAHDGTNLFIVDSNNHLIRRLVNETITTVAGSATTPLKGFVDGPAAGARFAFPRSVAWFAPQTLVVSDPNNSRIRRVNLATQTVSSVAGNGMLGFTADGVPATSAVLNGPTGAREDGAGRILVADQGNNRIRRFTITPAVGNIATVAGSGLIPNSGTGLGGFGGDGALATANGTLLDSPADAAADQFGNIFIADTANHLIRMVNGLGIITSIAGTVAPGFFEGTGLNGPVGVVVGPGTIIGATTALFIVDAGNQRIRALALQEVIP
jgi:hypothetical protein